MLLPGLLNQHNLFSHLAGLIKNNQQFQNLISEILTRSTSSLLHLLRIDQLRTECNAEFSLFEDQLNIKDEKIVFTSVSLGFLLNEISPLMSSLRLLQNLLVKLARTYEDVSGVPKSIADYLKNPNKYGLNNETKEILKKYWASTGKKLRDYRDIDQHYSVLTDQYFIQIKPQKTILLRFPDNPEVKSSAKFLYDLNINGLDFLKECFDELHSTYEELAKNYKAKPEQHQMNISLNQIGDLRPAKERTLAFSFEKSITNEDGINTINFSGLGCDQLPDLRLSFRKYFLDDDGIEKAKKIYGI